MGISQQDAAKLPAAPAGELFREAERLREKASGNRIELCAIISVKSGNCAMDCAFCSQSRRSRAEIPVYDLLARDKLEAEIRRLAQGPYRHIGLVAAGGRLGQADLKKIIAVLEKLPPEIQARLCASLGRLDAQSLALLKKAGLARYHHNLESCRSFYPSICSTQSWDARRDTVLRALDAGLEVCCGGLFGLGESFEDRVNFAFELAELGVSNIPLNFLHPHPLTPLGRRKAPTPDEALRIIAIFRHILPHAVLRVCGGRPTSLGARQEEMFAAGANALMSGDYLTTKGVGLERDLAMLTKLGLAPTRPDS